MSDSSLRASQNGHYAAMRSKIEQVAKEALRIAAQAAHSEQESQKPLPKARIAKRKSK